MQLTGKMILMKDIHNIKTRLLSSPERFSTNPHPQEHNNGLSLNTADLEEKDLVLHSQLAMVELVNNLIGESEQVAHGLPQDEKQHHEQQQQHREQERQDSQADSIASNSIPIHIPIPVSQISPSDLNSFLNTIVNTPQENNTMSRSNIDSQSYNNNTSATTTSELSHADTDDSQISHPPNIFPCHTIDSLSHNPREELSSSVFHASTLADVIPIVSKSPSLANALPNVHPGGHASHHIPVLNSFEDVGNIEISILQALPSWQEEVPYTNSERMSPHLTSSLFSLPNSQEHIQVTPPSSSHGLNTLENSQSTKVVLSSPIPSRFSVSMSPQAILFDSPPITAISHFQNLHYNQHTHQHLRSPKDEQRQHQQNVKKERKRTCKFSGPISNPSKIRRNALQSDRETVKRNFFQQCSTNSCVSDTLICLGE